MAMSSALGIQGFAAKRADGSGWATVLDASDLAAWLRAQPPGATLAEAADAVDLYGMQMVQAAQERR